MNEDYIDGLSLKLTVMKPTIQEVTIPITSPLEMNALEKLWGYRRGRRTVWPITLWHGPSELTVEAVVIAAKVLAGTHVDEKEKLDFQCNRRKLGLMRDKGRTGGRSRGR